MQIADLRSGKEMTLALPAELYGYPGPAHALGLAVDLKPTEAQRPRTQELFDRMQQEANSAGADVIEAERALDRLFRDKLVKADSLVAGTARAADAAGRLRAVHLRYQLAMMEVLTSQQIAEHQRLRDYR